MKFLPNAKAPSRRDVGVQNSRARIGRGVAPAVWILSIAVARLPDENDLDSNHGPRCKLELAHALVGEQQN